MKKKIRKSSTDAVIFGVCEGIAEHALRYIFYHSKTHILLLMYLLI
nr:PspC domain-containing protein [Sediminibacillus albus]